MTSAPRTQSELIEEGQGLVYSLASKIHRGLPMTVDLEGFTYLRQDQDGVRFDSHVSKQPNHENRLVLTVTEAALQRDYTLAMGMVLTYTVLLFTMNSIVDVMYAVIDPRVELQ